VGRRAGSQVCRCGATVRRDGARTTPQWRWKILYGEHSPPLPTFIHTCIHTCISIRLYVPRGGFSSDPGVPPGSQPQAGKSIVCFIHRNFSLIPCDTACALAYQKTLVKKLGWSEPHVPWSLLFRFREAWTPGCSSLFLCRHSCYRLPTAPHFFLLRHPSTCCLSCLCSVVAPITWCSLTPISDDRQGCL